MVLDGGSFSVNFATSAIGFLRISIVGEDDRELPGFGEEDMAELAGDRIDHTVKWKSGKSVADLAGKVVRVKFTLRDADLYSFAIRD